jgi:hypothetical protein
MYKKHPPKADIDWPYVKRKEGGRGLLQTEETDKAEILNVAEYVNTKYKKGQFYTLLKATNAINHT